MKLTVLGKYGPYPAAGGACSGYLLEWDGARAVLDLGSGCLSRLMARVNIKSINAVLATHLHADHTSDLPVLDYALEARRAGSFGRTREEASFADKINVYCPDKPEQEYARLCTARRLALIPTAHGDTWEMHGARITAFATQHGIPSLAYSVEWMGKKLVYTGDTAYHEGLRELVCGAHLLLCDVGCLHLQKQYYRTHLSAREAGMLAAECGVERLLLTHINPRLREDTLVKEAQSLHPHVEAAQENRTYAIERPT